MSDISLNFDGMDYVIDQDLFLGLKEEAYDRLKKTPNGLDSVIEDMDFETFRRMLPVIPRDTDNAAELLFETATGDDINGGLRGWIYQRFHNALGGAPPGNPCIETLTAIILSFGSKDIDGEVTPVSEGLWDHNDVEDLCLKTIKALQRCLSGQEVGY